MSYRENLYKNALKIIEEIYQQSKYDPSEDLYRSFDVMNAVNDLQLESKEWLVHNLLPFINKERFWPDTDGKLNDILVMDSWYGTVGIILKNHISPDIKIHNVDSDPLCETVSYKLIDGGYENIWPITDDAMEYYFERTDHFQLIINTSCEHMEKDDIQLVLRQKPYNTLICFQSNNYHAEPGHINTHDSLDSFVEELNLNAVYWKGELKPSEDYTQYMVIGK